MSILVVPILEKARNVYNYKDVHETLSLSDYGWGDLINFESAIDYTFDSYEDTCFLYLKNKNDYTTKEIYQHIVESNRILVTELFGVGLGELGNHIQYALEKGLVPLFTDNQESILFVKPKEEKIAPSEYDGLTFNILYSISDESFSNAVKFYEKKLNISIKSYIITIDENYTGILDSKEAKRISEIFKQPYDNRIIEIIRLAKELYADRMSELDTETLDAINLIELGMKNNCYFVIE